MSLPVCGRRARTQKIFVVQWHWPGARTDVQSHRGLLSGWAGISLNSAANTLMLLSFGRILFFPRALHVMLHLSQMFTSVCLLSPAKNTTIIYVSFQHLEWWGVSAEIQWMSESWCSAEPPAPAKQTTKERHLAPALWGRLLQVPSFSTLNH
jgi:hypothetical protein